MPVRIPQWTPDETEIVKTYVPTMGAHYAQFVYLQNRSLAEIKAKAIDLGILKNHNQVEPDINNIQKHLTRNWTLPEIIILHKYHPSLSGREIHEVFLPDKTTYAIVKMSARLGIPESDTKDTWEDIEVKNLITHTDIPLNELQKTFFPHRTMESITNKKKKLKVRQTGNGRKPWTPEEKKILKMQFKDADNEQLAESLGRTVQSVTSQAKQMRLKKGPGKTKTRWSPDDIEFLQANYKVMDDWKLAAALNRTIKSIRRQALRLNLK